MEKQPRKLLVLGLIITTIGAIWLMAKLDIGLPRWVISWKTIFILFGIVLGIQSNFKSLGAWILLGIGSYFLLDDFGWVDSSIRNYFFPVFAIGIGLFLIVKYFLTKDEQKNFSSLSTNEIGGSGEIPSYTQSHIAVESVLNTHRSKIISAQFQGGTTTTVLGSTELNFLDCPAKGTIRLKNTVLLGSLKLILPPNWEVQNQFSGVLSSSKDKRQTVLQVIPDCTLILAGDIILSSLEIVGN